MRVYVALLRAVNVGGTGKLAMSDLKALCEEAGFTRVKTYIQSGNVVFAAKIAERSVKAALEKAIAAKVGKPTGVILRSADELEAVIASSPFPEAKPNQLLVLFLDEAPPVDALAGLAIPGREAVELRGREIYVHYPDGMGESKLKLPHAKTGTGRNLNTVVKLAAMARAIEGE